MNYLDMKDKYVKNALQFERMNYHISEKSKFFIANIYRRIAEMVETKYSYEQYQYNVKKIMVEEFAELDNFVKGEILTIYNKENNDISKIIKQTLKEESSKSLIELNNQNILLNVTEANDFYKVEFTKYKNEMYGTILKNVNTAIISNYSVEKTKTFITATQNLSKSQVTTITRTVMKNTQNEVSKSLYKSNGLNFVRFTAILDNRTTSACRDLNNKIFRIDDAPRLPLHYNCRSTYIPLLDRQIKDAEKDVEDFTAWYMRNKNDPDLKNYGFIMK